MVIDTAADPSSSIRNQTAVTCGVPSGPIVDSDAISGVAARVRCESAAHLIRLRRWLI
ncbi:hypothetical protein MBRU_07495 [Mycolicibacterium brumae DSM 44177]|nr:hypothetical protein MBRU_07495 [Mycolicibacterium brumae DSM 44177]